LYGAFDRAVGHVRRYTPRTLQRAIEDAGLQLTQLRPVNMLGAIAWWFAVRVGGSTQPHASLVGAYDRVVVPIVRAMERRVRPPFGQSLLCVANLQPASTPAGERSGNS